MGLLDRLFKREPTAVAVDERRETASTTSVVAPRQPANQRSGSRRVLVVEDDDSLRDLVSRNLVARGHLVREAADAAEALEALRQELPEIVVLDVNLPDATGWDILRTAQLDPSTAVIMLTAVPVSPKRLAEFRPVAYLPKPFPLDALLRLVEQSGRRTEERDANAE